MIQHALSKPSFVNLISKDANLVFYLSVYPIGLLLYALNLRGNDNDCYPH